MLMKLYRLLYLVTKMYKICLTMFANILSYIMFYWPVAD